MGFNKIAKKIRFLKEINTLYSYIFSRAYVKARSFLKLPPLYPYEENYRLDEGTQHIIDQLQRTIPDGQRGDNPSFNKNWKSIAEREETAKQISSQIKKLTPETGASADANLLSSIKDAGYTKLEQKNFNAAQVDKIIAYLNDKKVYPAHVAHFSVEKPKAKDIIKKNNTFGSYDMQTIIQAPYVAEMIADPEMIGLITDYFGCLPTISSVNLFWAFSSSDGKSRGPQRFHRDIDDYKTCTMFINLTDTKEDEGAHCYIEKTHTLDRLKTIFPGSRNDDLPQDLNPFKRRVTPEDLFQLPLNGYSFDKLYEHFLKEHMVHLYGPKGNVLITDNYGIHRGLPSKNNDRLILWVSFALTATHTQSAEVKPQKRIAYAMVNGRIANNEINRYVLRNVIDFSS